MGSSCPSIVVYSYFTSLAQRFWFLLSVLIFKIHYFLLLLGLNLMMSVWQKKIQREHWMNNTVVRKRYFSYSCTLFTYTCAFYIRKSLYVWRKFLLCIAHAKWLFLLNSYPTQILGSIIHHLNLQNIQMRICLSIYVKVTRKRSYAMWMRRT